MTQVLKNAASLRLGIAASTSCSRLRQGKSAESAVASLLTTASLTSPGQCDLNCNANLRNKCVILCFAMDPLSITASILTLLGAITTTVKTAKALRNAPSEVQALLNSLTDAQMIVLNVNSFLKENYQAYISQVFKQKCHSYRPSSV